MRESLPRKAKDYKRDKQPSEKSTDIYCYCGSSPSERCCPNKCIRCCTDASCGARRHKKQQIRNYEKRKKMTYYDSENSSDEDTPLVNVRKRKQSHTTRESSPSTDEEWTPYKSKEKKKFKMRGGSLKDSNEFSQQILHVPHSSVLPSLIRIPTVTPTHHVPVSSRCASSHLNSSLNQQKSIWNPSDLRMPSLTTMLANASSQKSRGSSHPITATVRLPMVSASRLHTQHRILPYNGVHHSSPDVSSRKKNIPSPSKFNISHLSGGNSEKRPIDSRTEKEDDHILMFYVRYPYSQYCDQTRVIDLFRPYCSLKHIQWLDKRSAYITISEDATFQTYDFIFLNLVMKSDYENDNILYVSPYTDYIKKKSGNETIKKEKTEI